MKKKCSKQFTNISDLGWVKVEEKDREQTLNENGIYGDSTFKLHKYYLMELDPNHTIIRSYNKTNPKKYTQLFNGYLESKEDLVTLMKWLKIKK